MNNDFITQDTIRPSIVVKISTQNLIPDSVFRKLDEKPAFIRYADSLNKSRVYRPAWENLVISDTTSVCARNPVADVTFYDEANFISAERINTVQLTFPFRFAEKPAQATSNTQIALITDLREGATLPFRPFHSDLIIAVILFAAYLYVIVRSTTRKMMPELIRFFLLRGINEAASRDTASLFYWQSTIMNLISYIIFGLFAFCAAVWYEFIPANTSPVLFLFIAFGLVVFGITSRHFICVAAGNLSGQSDMFNEYLITVYQSYRFSSVFLFVLIVLLVYTRILPPSAYFVAGLTVLLVFYFYRVLRLLLIFIKRDVSILYLILYLCALEILPVLILIKYLSGFVLG